MGTLFCELKLNIHTTCSQTASSQHWLIYSHVSLTMKYSDRLTDCFMFVCLFVCFINIFTAPTIGCPRSFHQTWVNYYGI
jgi:hypothetical protein